MYKGRVDGALNYIKYFLANYDCVSIGGLTPGGDADCNYERDPLTTKFESEAVEKLKSLHEYMKRIEKRLVEMSKEKRATDIDDWEKVVTLLEKKLSDFY